MAIMFNEEAWEFTAKTMGDLGKNLLTVCFASYFFKDLPLPIRIGIGILSVGLITASIIMISKKGDKKWN